MVESIKSGPVPRYYQLMEFIWARIRSGEWAPGMPIPSERELCERHGISRMTARQSISVLVNEGLLYREQGKGTCAGSRPPGGGSRSNTPRSSIGVTSIAFIPV